MCRPKPPASSGPARLPAGNLPPRVQHAVLPAATTQGRRVIIVGDVHGCVDELRTLLAKCGYRKGTDVVVLVGDLVRCSMTRDRVQIVLYMAHASLASVVWQVARLSSLLNALPVLLCR